MKKGVVFDLDGTLWDASNQVVISWRMALLDCQDIKRKITVADMQGVMGKTMEQIADILFAEAAPPRRMEVLKHCMEVENAYIEKHGGCLFAGLEETLQELQKNYHLYIVSNCQKGYIEAFLEYHKLAGYFTDFECYGATNRSKGDNIHLVTTRNKLTHAVYVGDTQGDYEAATDAGLPFIHARMGYGTVAAAVPYITSLEELPKAVLAYLEER